MARPIVNELHLTSPGVGCAPEGAERELTRQLQAGSEAAFDELVSQYAPAVYRVAHRLLRQPADASDTVQEVFLKVFRSIGRFHGQCSLKTWIYRITVNTVWNQNRWWRRHSEPECSWSDSDSDSGLEKLAEPGASPNPFDSVLSQEMQVLVHEALSHLSESHRMILVLREMEGLDYEEVAEILHVSLGTVKSRLTRARHALRRELEILMVPAARSVPAWTPAK